MERRYIEHLANSWINLILKMNLFPVHEQNSRFLDSCTVFAWVIQKKKRLVKFYAILKSYICWMLIF